jgi:hypothetical protein
MVTLTTLQLVGDVDCRRFKKDYGDPVKNDRDHIDWCYTHQIENKYQGIIRRQYLHHFYGVRAYDLALALKRAYLLSSENIYLIMQHMLYYNKHVEIDQLDQDDERKFMIYSRPRFKKNVEFPYSIFCYKYYDDMAKINA